MQTLKVAFGKIHEVKSVPGLPNNATPGFFQRYLYWRECCLFSASFFGFFLASACIVKDAMRVRNLRGQLGNFPAELQEHFRYYVYLTLAASVLMTGMTVAVVFMLWAACCHQRNFVLSLAKERQAWGLLILGPFLPFVVIPLGAAFSTRALQRDICAVTLIGLLKTSMTRGMVQEAAGRIGEQDLAVTALYAPPPWGTEEYQQWEGRQWCKERYSDWEKVLFGTDWVKSSYMGFRDPRLSLPLPGQSKHPGVVPEVVRGMMGSIGVFADPTLSFCYDDFLLKAQAIRDAFRHLKEKGGSLLEDDEASEGPEPEGSLALGDTDGAVRFSSVQQRHAWLEVQFAAEGRRLSNTSRASSFAEERDELLQLRLRHPLGVFTKIALSAVCYTFRGAMGLLRVARLTNLVIVRMVGFLGAVQCVQLLGLSIFSVVDGLVEGVVNVKKVIPTASLPGHLLSIAAITSLPPILLILGIIAQILAHVASSLACGCLALWRLLDLWRAALMSSTEKHKEAMKLFDAVTGWQGRLVWLALFFFLVFAGRMLYLVKGGYVLTAGLPSLENIKPRDLLNGPEIVAAISRYLTVRILTLLVATDIVMAATFDSADDELLGDGAESEDIVNGWRKLMGMEMLPQRGRGEAAAPAEALLPPIVFRVQLQKIGDAKLGIVIGARPDCLLVEEVAGGLVGAWNAQSDWEQVQEGDEIVEVNGAAGDSQAMRERLRLDEALELTVRRRMSQE